MFCRNCGAKLDEGTKFCPACGSQVTVNEAAPESSGSSLKNNMIIRIAAIAVAAVVIVFAVVKLTGNSGYEGTMEKFFEAIENDDTELLFSVFVFPQMKDYLLEEDYYSSEYELFSDFSAEMEDTFESITDIEYEITDVQTYSLQLWAEDYSYLTEEMGVEAEEAVTLTVDMKYLDSGEVMNETAEFVVVNMEGNWYIADGDSLW